MKFRSFGTYATIKEATEKHLARTEGRLSEMESLPAGRQTDKSALPHLEKLIRLLWNRYHEETRQFISELAKKDPEVKEQLDRALAADEPALDQPANHVPDENNPSVHQIVPPRSDMPAGAEQ